MESPTTPVTINTSYFYFISLISFPQQNGCLKPFMYYGGRDQGLQRAGGTTIVQRHSVCVAGPGLSVCSQAASEGSLKAVTWAMVTLGGTGMTWASGQLVWQC